MKTVSMKLNLVLCLAVMLNPSVASLVDVSSKSISPVREAIVFLRLLGTFLIGFPQFLLLSPLPFTGVVRPAIPLFNFCLGLVLSRDLLEVCLHNPFQCKLSRVKQTIRKPLILPRHQIRVARRFIGQIFSRDFKPVISFGIRSFQIISLTLQSFAYRQMASSMVSKVVATVVSMDLEKKTLRG